MYLLPFLELATTEHSMLAMLPMLEFTMMLELATMMLELTTMMAMNIVAPMTPLMAIWIVAPMSPFMAIWIVASMLRRTMRHVVKSIGSGGGGSTPSH